MRQAATRYRERASKARARADEISDPVSKKAWFDVAAEWEDMANNMDRAATRQEDIDRK
jgi:hypothetical protein